MRHTFPLIASIALSLFVGCDAPPDAEPLEPIETHWAPFEQGATSTGDSGRARFQVAPCAYPEVAPQMPTCALDMPFLHGHRTGVLVELAGGSAEHVIVRSANEDVLALRDFHLVGDSGIYKFELHAAQIGSAELVVEGADGIVDTLTIQVRDAVALDIEVDGADLTDDELRVAVGGSALVRARPVDAAGNLLNAYEVDWSLAGDAGVTNTVADFHTWVARVDGVAPGTATLSASAGSAAARLPLRVISEPDA